MTTPTSPVISFTAPPAITAETKFMQNFRIASAVNGGGAVFAVQNGNGQVEVFTTGTDGTLWNFYPDPTSDTGYSGISTNLSAAALAFAAGVDGNGNIVVFAASGLQLQYVVEDPASTSRWSAPQPVSVPQPFNPTRIAAVLARNVAGSLYVGVLTQFPGSTGTLYQLAYSLWQTENPAFQSTQLSVGSTNCVWLGNSTQTLAFACIDTQIVALDIASGQQTLLPTTMPFTSLSVAAALDSSGNDQIFAILADFNAYHLVGGAEGPFTWSALSQGMTLRQIEVETDDEGDVQVFAVSGDNQIYHWEPEVTSPSGYSSPPASIAFSVALLGVVANGAGAINLFTVGTAQATLTHLFQEEASTNWVAEPLEVPTNGTVETYISYTSEIGIFDALGVVLVNTPVNVWTSEESLVTINGATYFTGPNTPVQPSTNGAGILSIAQQTGSLAVPSLQLNVPSLPGPPIAIQQYAGVQGTLANVTGSDLMNATDTSGNFIIPDQFRTPANTDSMAAAFNECMSLVGTPTDAIRFPTRRGDRPGVWWRTAGGASDLRRIASPSVAQSWRLTFSGDAVIYQGLTIGEAQAFLAEQRSASFLDWIGSVGDLLQGAVVGAIDLLDIVVTSTIGNPVTFAFTFIANSVAYVLETVITFVDQLFDVVQMIFAQVRVVFEEVFEWLGFLFDWPHILLTQQAIVYSLNQLFPFLQGGVASVQSTLDNGINNVQGQVTALFQKAIANIAGSSTVGGYLESQQKPLPEFYYFAVANNVLLDGVADNASAGQPGSTLTPPAPGSPIAQFMAQLQAFAETTETNSAFANAVAYFENLGSSPDQIFSQLLSGLLAVAEAIVQAILSGVQAIVDGLLGLVQALIGAFQAQLNSAWNIPFISQFYSWITNGSELTFMGLFALCAAIPMTVLYKVLNGAAPFPAAADLMAFKSSFNAQTMLQASGLGLGTDSVVLEASFDVAEFCTFMLAVLPAGYYFLSACADAIPPLPQNDPPEIPAFASSLLSGGALFFELCTQFGTFPWFTLSGSPDCTTAVGTTITNWIYEVAGIILDIVYSIIAAKLPENANDIGVVVAGIYGILHLIPAIAASVAAPDEEEAAGFIAPVIAEIGKLSRLSFVVEATGFGSLFVVITLDALAGIVTTYLNVKELLSTATLQASGIGAVGAASGVGAVCGSVLRRSGM